MMVTDPQTDMALYEYMYDRKWIRGWNWGEISKALQLGLNGNSMQKHYSRLVEKVGKPYKPAPLFDQGSTVVLDNSVELSDMSDDDIEAIPYGDIPPTGYISDLNHDEWSEEYMVFDDYYLMTPEEITAFKTLWRLPYLSELRRRIWDENELMVLLPRGYAKTETVIGLFTRWFAEIKLPIYIITPSNPHSEDILNRIESHLQSPAMRRRYGDIGGKSTRGKSMMILNYHEDIKWTGFDRPISLVTFVSGKKGRHPAWIHLEDVMQDEAVSAETNDRVKHRFNSTYRLMRKRNREGLLTKMTATGTRYGLLDMYHYLIHTHDFNVLHYRALLSDKRMLRCPNYTLKDLLKSKKINSATFETEMQNNPVPSTGIYFNEAEWKTTRIKPLREHGAQFYMAIDTARGVTDAADNTSIMIVAMHEGRATVIDGVVGRLDDEQKTFYIHKFYWMYSPAFTLIDNAFAQVDMRRFAYIIGLIPFRDTTDNAKILRINAMQPYFAEKLIYVLEDMPAYIEDMPSLYEYLHNEYLSYNQKKSTAYRKDDALDTLSMIIQRFGDYLNIYNESQVTYDGTEDFHLSTTNYN